jgi:hypothetical protein
LTLDSWSETDGAALPELPDLELKDSNLDLRLLSAELNAENASAFGVFK